MVVLPTRRKARLDGWDLDAEVSVPAHRPGQLEVLCRYVLRPPIALDRIHRLGPELCALKLKPPYRDGTNHVTMSAQTLLGRLASLVWRPRVRALTYAGVLAPHAKRRAKVVAKPAEEDTPDVHDRSFAALLRHSFGLDLLCCPRCRGRMRFVNVVHDRDQVRRLLESLEL